MVEPGEIIDRYTVEEVLGQGGMAVVYRVRHNQLDSLHALKILTITNPGIKDRLLQEGRVQASLRHPNIVAVTDVLEVRGAPGLVMEFIEGPGLDEWLRLHQPTVEQSVGLFEAICLGVAHAHDKGVIHRDLKPANVMMAPASGMWVPKVADFGLAKAVTEDGSMQKTRSGVTMGTPQYMAPEQIRDAKNVDERADVFSLGCILYELVCGRPPFTGPDILSIFNAVASGSFPAAVSLVPDLPPTVRDAIEGALVVDRERRLGSVHQLIEVLRGAPLPAPAAAASMERPRGGAGQHTWAPDAGGGVAVAASLGTRVGPPSGPGTGTLDVGSAPSLPTGAASKRRLGPVIGAGLVGLGLLGAAGVAALLGGAFFAGSAVESAVEAALVAHGDLSASDVSLGAGGLVLTDFAIDGPDGKPVLSAESLRFEAKPIAFRGNEWAVDRLVITGLSGELARGADGRFHLSGATEALLREGSGFGLRAREVLVEEGAVALRSEGGQLDVEWDAATLRDFELDNRAAMSWSASAGGVRGLDIGGADPLLELDELRVKEGKAEVDGLELWVRGRTDGALDLPPVIADEIADWAGGQRHKPEGRDWLGIDLTGLPVAITELQASSGTLHLVERAHGVKTASWDVTLDRVGIGPVGADRTPIGLSGAMGEGRLTIDGDVARDGLIRLAVAGRYIPVDALDPYIKPSLDKFGVKPDGGTLDFSLALTAQRNTFAAAMDVEGAQLAFAAEGSPDRRARRLMSTRAKVEASTFIEGNLADQGFAPLGQAIAHTIDLLFAPAGGAVEDEAQKRERERARRQKEKELAEARAAAAAAEETAQPDPEPAAVKPDPAPTGEPMTRDDPAPAEPEPAADEPDAEEPVKDAFQRVNRGVRDALEDFRIRKK